MDTGGAKSWTWILLRGWTCRGGPSVSPQSTKRKHCRAWTVLLTLFGVCSDVRWLHTDLMSGRATQTTVWILMCWMQQQCLLVGCFYRPPLKVNFSICSALSSIRLRFLFTVQRSLPSPWHIDSLPCDAWPFRILSSCWFCPFAFIIMIIVWWEKCALRRSLQRFPVQIFLSSPRWQKKVWS